MDVGVSLVGHKRIYELENIIRAAFKNVNIDFSCLSENKVISELKDDGVATKLIIDGNTYEGFFSPSSDKPYLNKPGLMTNLSFADAYRKYKPFNLPWGVLIGIRPQKKVSDLRKMGYDTEKIREILISDFLISEKRADLMIKTDAFEENVTRNMNKRGNSIYIGIPFCKTRCAYCSFISKALGDERELDTFLDCLIKEIESAKGLKNIETVYIGGGTPTVLNEKQLERLLYKINTTFDLSEVKEFCVEGGRPDSITDGKLKILKEMNVGRISINPQTLNDKTLREIKRAHTKKDFFEAFYKARCAGFKAINTDLIAGLFGETLDDYKYSLDEIYKLSPENITVHTLSIKRAAEYTMENSSDNIAAAMQDYTYNKLSDYMPYYMYRQKNTLDNLENVGYTKPGYECLYNIYMMREIQNIIAFGGGGVTKIIGEGEILRIRNPKDPASYIKDIDSIILKKRKYI